MKASPKFLLLPFLAICAWATSPSADASLITTTGSGAGFDITLAMDETFDITTAGTLRIMSIGYAADSERDVFRYGGAGQLTVELNGFPVATSYQDFNDGASGFGLGSYVWLNGAPFVSPGDEIRISGMLSGGSFNSSMSDGSPATFGLLPTGQYHIELMDQSLNVLAVAVPEAGESLIVLCGMGGMLFGARRRKRG